MITGDHTFTACHVSFKCGISNPYKKMIICDIKNGVFKIEEFKYVPTTEEKKAYS
jgi:magnesium-transporting ATPase (P-type)